MNKIWRQVVLTASALATSALLAACGGGDAGAPPDKTPPTVAISSNTTGTAQGPVTFTFVFSEDVGTSFSADDVDAGAASKGAFTRFTGTVASLVVTPPANSSGTFQVSVPAGAFADAAGNDNTASATVSQSFDTSTGQASGNTGTCTGSCIDFASASVKYEAFEGLVSAAQASDPADANNKVAKFVKGPAGQPWAGATIYTVDANKSVPAIDLSGSKVITLRIYAPAVGQTVRLKIEDAADPTKSIERDYVTTKANEWVTASFDFAAPSNGSYDAAATYNRVSLFPVFSVTAPPAADTTYYFDELKYTAATGGGGAVSGNTGTCTAPCIDFSSAAVKYDAFEGLVSAAQANDPVDANNKVAKFVKGPAGQPWAGATIYTVDADKSVTAIDLSGSKVITMRVYAPAVGQTVRLKIENAGDPTKSIEKDYVTTKANEWVTASFDFAAPSNGSYDAAVTYNKVSVFPVFSVSAPPAADTTYYFDELKYTAATGGGSVSGNTGTCTAPCIDFASASVKYDAFEGLVSAAQANDPVDAGNKVAKFVKGPAGQPWAGATIYTVDANKSVPAIDLSGSKVITLRVYAPAVGQTVRLKIENAADPTKSIEKDYVTTKANEWVTASFDFAAPSNGSYDAAATYNKVSLFPLFSVSAPPAADTTYYFDELKYTAATGGGGGGGAILKFASNYADAPPAWRSTELGDAGIYIDGSVPTQFWWSGIAPNDATPSFYFGYGISVAQKPWGFGAFVKAPGNGTANVSGYSNLKISVWGNDQLVNTLPTFTVILKGPSVANCVSELKTTLVVTGPGVQTYTLPLNSFTLQTACAYGSPAAALAAGVNEVHIQVLGNNVQYTSGGDAGGFYPNGLNVGPISFGN